MGIYQDGIEGLGEIKYSAMQPRNVRARIGDGLGWFASPGETRAKARELEAAAQVLHTAILGYTPSPELATAWEQWRKGWVDWLAALNALVNEIKAEGFTPPLFYGDALEQYEHSLAQWRQDFETQWRGHVPGPMIARPAPPQGETFWHKVGLGVTVALAVTSIVYFAKEAVSK